jgi:hypothetical protein
MRFRPCALNSMFFYLLMLIARFELSHHKRLITPCFPSYFIL